MKDVGRNDPCPCGCGKKFKMCSYQLHNEQVDGLNIPSEQNHFELVKVFKDLNINTKKPGFYDNKAFIEVERAIPDFLNQYANFVASKVYSQGYLARAEHEIPIIAGILFNELKKSGRMGACADISMVLSRCLEEEGFWNYIAAGPLTIHFDSKSGKSDKYFWPVDKSLPHGAVAHAWVVAPPFTIIDLSVSFQSYSDGEAVLIPAYVLDKTEAIASYSAVDIFAPEIRAKLYSSGYTIDKMIQNTLPSALPVIKRFPPRKVVGDHATLKYITIAIKAPDGLFEKMENISFCGKRPYEVYQKVVKPALHKTRGHLPTN